MTNPSLFGQNATDIPIVSAEDAAVEHLFPTGFTDLYEVHSYRNAAHILAHACATEFTELTRTLLGFRIRTEDMVKAGGNKTEIAKAVEQLFQPVGWSETRIEAELQIIRHSRYKEARTLKSGPRKGQTTFETKEKKDLYRIPGFVSGHKIDFVKKRVAFDLEWNSKDQTFDRDLYAVRAFYECNIVSVGVLLTRSATLKDMFKEINRRVNIDDFGSKFGASTTWMGKLTDRLTAGRGGGCPVLALGITPAIVSDFDVWKAANPVIPEKSGATFEIDEAG